MNKNIENNKKCEQIKLNYLNDYHSDIVNKINNINNSIYKLNIELKENDNYIDNLKKQKDKLNMEINRVKQLQDVISNNNKILNNIYKIT